MTEDRVALVPKSKVRLEGLDHRGSPISELELLKGGRYLFTLASQNQTGRLWDLGVPGSAPLEKPLLVAGVTPQLGSWSAVWELCVRGECIKFAILDAQTQV